MAVPKDESADRIGSANAAEARGLEDWGIQTEEGANSCLHITPCPAGWSNGSNPGPLHPCLFLLCLVTKMDPPPDGRLSGEGYKFLGLILRTGDPFFFLSHPARLLRLQALTLAY